MTAALHYPIRMLGLVSGALVGALPAMAADQPAKSGWVVVVGGALEYGPDFIGASEQSVGPVFSDLEIYPQGDTGSFGAPDDGYELPLVDVGWLNAGIVGDYAGERSTADDDRLRGLDRIPGTVTLGAYGEVWPIQDHLRARIEVMQGLRADAGIVANLFADWVQPMGDFTFSAGPRLTLGNGPYMRDTFGVSTAEAGRSQFAAYRPDGGIQSVGATVALSYAISPVWTVTIYDSYARLVDDAADSPIVDGIGSDDQNVVGLSLEYAFHIGF